MAVISSQPNKKNYSQLFKDRRHKTSGFVLSLLIVMALMVSDYRYHYLNILRYSFSVIVVPMHSVVDYPVRVVGWLQALVSSKTALVNENIQLRYQQTLLEAQLQKLTIIQKENSQLRELLKTAKTEKFKTMAAHIMAVETGNARQLLVINQGVRAGVYTGQPVLDAKGVVGQVIDVGPFSSVVLMISDAKSAVPVRVNRTGERAILTGNNDISALSLINLPRTSSIREGDLLITSGLANRYPEGFPVAVVEKISNLPGEPFIKVQAKPMAMLNRDRLVLLVWPDKKKVENILNQQDSK